MLGLDRRVLVHRQHQRALGRAEVEAAHLLDGEQHLALVRGAVQGEDAVLVVCTPNASLTCSKNPGSSRRLSQPRTRSRRMSMARRMRHSCDTKICTPSSHSVCASSP
jgi:hypothetical protein